MLTDRQYNKLKRQNKDLILISINDFKDHANSLNRTTESDIDRLIDNLKQCKRDLRDIEERY